MSHSFLLSVLSRPMISVVCNCYTASIPGLGSSFGMQGLCALAFSPLTCTYVQDCTCTLWNGHAPALRRKCDRVPGSPNTHALLLPDPNIPISGSDPPGTGGGFLRLDASETTCHPSHTNTCPLLSLPPMSKARKRCHI
jgi:hypothetical protein